MSPASRWNRLSRRASLRDGFTLVEMLVVIVVLALLAAVVVTRWSGVHHNAVVASTLGKLEFVDQQLRQFARSRGTPCLLEFDGERGRFRKRYASSEGDNPAWESLGTGVTISSIRIGVEKPASRELGIPVDVNGQTPTYGICLKGPGQRETWLLFAGVTGEMNQFETREDWNAAFELLKSPSL